MFAAVFFVPKLWKGRRRKNRNAVAILYFYFAVLLIAMPVSYFLMPDTIGKTKRIEVTDGPELYELQNEGKLSTKEAEKYIRKQEKFDFNDKKLTIRTGDSGVSALINGRGKQGEIEVIFYQTPFVVLNQVDITDELPKPEFTLEDGELHIDTSLKEFKYVAYKGAFPFEQFDKGGDINREYGEEFGMDSWSVGEQIYIKVPKGVEVVDAEGDDLYIEE